MNGGSTLSYDDDVLWCTHAHEILQSLLRATLSAHHPKHPTPSSTSIARSLTRTVRIRITQQTIVSFERQLFPKLLSSFDLSARSSWRRTDVVMASHPACGASLFENSTRSGQLVFYVVFACSSLTPSSHQDPGIPILFCSYTTLYLIFCSAQLLT